MSAYVVFPLALPPSHILDFDHFRRPASLSSRNPFPVGCSSRPKPRERLRTCSFRWYRVWLGFPSTLLFRFLGPSPLNAVDFNSRMNAQIENLVKLQAIELNRARLNQEMRALPAEIAQAVAALAAAERQSADLSAALGREDSMRTRLDREIGDHRKKVARFRIQLDTITTPEQAAAIEHEIQFATSEAERMESDEYQSLERTEAHEAALAQTRAQVEQLAAGVDAVRARVANRQHELT